MNMDDQRIQGPLSFVGALGVDYLERAEQRKARQFQKEAERHQRQMWRQQRRQQRQSVPPATKTLRRSLCGAGLLTVCLWLSPGMLNIFRWSVANPANALWPPLAVWAFAALVGVVALRVGLKEAPDRVPKNPMGAFWAACVMIGIGALFLKIVPADAVAAYLVRGVYVTGFAVVAVYFWIASGLAVGNAERRIRRLANARNAPLRPSRPRRWFFLWLW